MRQRDGISSPFNRIKWPKLNRLVVALRFQMQKLQDERKHALSSNPAKCDSEHEVTGPPDVQTPRILPPACDLV